MATKLTAAWIKKGTDKPIETSASRTRINILGALELDSMEIAIKEYKTINSESLVDFWSYLRSQYSESDKINVILDQSSYNTSEETKQAAKKENIILHYLPPYSPNLNPIERVWKIMNKYVRNNYFFSSPKEFRNNIFEFFNQTWGKINNSLGSWVNDNFETLNSFSPESSFSTA